MATQVQLVGCLLILLDRQLIPPIQSTVLLELKANDQNDNFPSISGGGLGSTYIFQQLHFHWGSDDSRGSEHRIDNRKFAAELHMVHYNSKYANYPAATAQPDGLAVLAIPIELEKRDNVAFRHIEHFEQIMHPDGNPVSQLDKPIYLEDLLPDNTDSFFRYEGSLTTPTCNQVVSWAIFNSAIALSERQVLTTPSIHSSHFLQLSTLLKQLNMFRALFDEEGLQLVDNFREPQSLSDRVVRYRPSSAKNKIRKSSAN